MEIKNVPDLLLRLFFGAALITGGILTLNHASGGTIVSCKAATLQTASCTITERLAFSKQITQEKSISGIVKAKVATITASNSESPDVEFFRVLGMNKKGVSYQIGQDGKDFAEAESVAEQINSLIQHPNTSTIQFDYSSNLSNWFGWGAISLGIIVSLFMRPGK
jgi:hypothetical protein